MTQGNGIAITILLGMVLISVFFGIKNGRIKIKTDKFAIIGSSRENERLVIQRQLNWLFDAVFAFEQRIPMDENYDKYRGRYILAILYTDMTEWVLYNHIEESKHYVEIKQSEIWNKALTMVEKNELKTGKFKTMVEDYVKYIIHNLVAIRKEYEKNES